MALERKEGKLVIPLEGKARELDFELVKVKDDLFLLLGKERDYSKVDEKIFSFIKSKPLASLVEGKFEENLSQEEAERLAQLVKDGVVEKFKLSDKYKKAVYRMGKHSHPSPVEEKNSPPQEKIFEEKVIEESDKNDSGTNQSALDKNGFLVAKNELFVKNLSERFAEQIRRNELKGIKGFDEAFYIIKKDVYDKEKGKILNALKNRKGVNCSELSSELKMEKELVKAVCEFLKDEGEIMEKRKELYCFIE